jgi:HSP20 family protein
MLTCRVNRNPAAVSREFDRLMNSMFQGVPSMFSPGVLFAGSPLHAARGSGWESPSAGGLGALNVWEDAQTFYVETEVPGIPMENIDVNLTASELTIKGSRTVEAAGDDVVTHRRERASGEFTRSIRLSTPIDAEKATASLKHGVLLITLPKAAEARARRIAVAQ